QGPRGSWLRDGAVDVAARGHADRAARTRAVPPRSRLVHPAAPWVVTPTSHAAGARARRGGDRAVEARWPQVKKTRGAADPGSSSTTRVASRIDRSSAAPGPRAATRRF